MFPLDNFTLSLVKTNIENCDMKFETEIFLLFIHETKKKRLYKTLKRVKPLFKPESSGGQHPKYHHCALSERIPVVGIFNHNQSF